MKTNKSIWTKIVAAFTAFALLIPASLSPVALAAGADGVTKSESVYVNTDSQGSVKDETVSVWLHDDTAGSVLTDKADLQDITNVKGDEQPEVSGGSVTWKLSGTDLYYQGTTTKQLPVKVQMKYYLDGQEIAPDKLAGKSGKFEMKVSFQNLDSHTVSIDGKDKTLYTPLICATAFDLPKKVFGNVKTNFGTVLGDGTNQVVSFVNMPGLKQSFDMISNYVDFPDELDITADVTNFELGPVMVLVSPLPDMDSLKDTKDLTDLLSKLDKMYDAGNELQNATGDLNQGENDFADGVKELYNGVRTAGSSFDQIVDGADTLYSGMSSTTTGTPALIKGINALYSGAKQLYGGTKQLLAQFGSGSAASPTLKYSINALSGGAKQVSQGLGQLLGQFANGSASNPTLKYSVNALKGGAAQVSGGLKQLLGQFGDGSSTMKAKVKSLASGTDSYVDTSKALISALRGNSDVYNAILADLPSNPRLAAALVLLTGSAQMSTTEAALGVSEEYIKTAQATYSGGGTAIAKGSKALANQFSTSGDPKNPSLYDLVNELSAGADQVAGGAGQLAGQMTTSGSAKNPSLYDYLNQLAAGSQQMAGGAAQLNAQMSTSGNASKPSLYDSIASLNSGAKQIVDGLQKLVSSSAKLKELQSGMKQIRDALVKFQAGMSTLQNGASELKDNSVKLTDGTKALDDGMTKFWNEGLRKLHGADRDKIDEALKVKDELIKLSDNYTSFSGVGGTIKSSVKFIVKSDEINAPAAAVSDTTAKPVENKGFFQRIGDWFVSLFKK